MNNNSENLVVEDEFKIVDDITSTTLEVVSNSSNNTDLPPPLFTDEDETTTTVPTTTTTVPTTTTTVPTTTTTVPECKDEDFKAYTLYDLDGNANTVMTCRNQQNALASGFIYTVNPKPPPTTTTTTVPVSSNYTFEQNWYNTFTYQYGIDVDSSKNLYVAGMNNRSDTTIGTQAVSSSSGERMIVYKLNYLGDLEWLKTFGNSEQNNVYDIAVDQNGYSIITGSFSGSIDFGTGMKTAPGSLSSFVLKLDPNGETEWVFTPTNSNMVDTGMRVDTDSSGNIYVGGYINSGNTPYAVTYGSFTVTSRYTTTYLKLNSNGEVLWVKALDGGISPGSVYVDSEDNKYLSGHCWGSEYNFNGGAVTFSNIDGDDIVTLYCGQQASTPDAYVIKLDSSDNYVWHWNDRAYDSDSTEVISNSNGDVYVSYFVSYSNQSICGTSLNSGTSDYFNVLVKLDSTGTCQWFYRTEHTTNDRNKILRLGLDSNNNIYFRNAEKVSSGYYRTNIYVFNDQGVLKNSTFSENYYHYDFVFDSDDNFYSIHHSKVIKRTLSDLE